MERNQEILAQQWGIDPVHFSGVLNGRRPAGPKMLKLIANEIPDMPIGVMVLCDRDNRPKDHPLWINFYHSWRTGRRELRVNPSKKAA